MATSSQAVRAAAVIALLGIVLIPPSSSHAQDLAGTSVSLTAYPQSSPTMVNYRDGLLTIDARDSTLADVLNPVVDKTGAAIDIPPSAALERLCEQTRRRPIDDVLSGLLNGSAFDFVIVGSPQPSHSLIRILLLDESGMAHVWTPEALTDIGCHP